MPSRATPTPRRSMTSHMKIIGECGCAALFRSKACPRIACCPRTTIIKTARRREQEARKQQDFATMILDDNLRKAGVQNTHKGERLTFDRLDPYAGAWLHAAGEYS